MYRIKGRKFVLIYDHCTHGKSSTAEEIKNKANEEYKNKRYDEAVKLYSEAIGKVICLYRFTFLQRLS